MAFTNRLLVALPRRDLDRLKASFDDVECKYRDILIESDSTLSRVYFPGSGVISILAVYPDGHTIEMATIGREGSTAIQAVFGAKSSSVRLLVQVPGQAMCMTRSAFDWAMAELPSFRALVFAHSQAFLEQVMVSGGCNGAHTVRQRLARWLLMMWDRHDDDELPITQDLMAEMLGVHRPTVTKAARHLQKQGLIKLERKRVTLLDHDRLAGASCECYQMVRMRTAQLLPKTYIR